MAMKLRTLRNTGEPLVDAQGNILSNVKVTFTLADQYGVPSDSWDVVNHYRIASVPIEVVTDNKGEFSVDLWPTSRAASEVYYLCLVDLPDVHDFLSPVVDDSSPLAWMVFKTSGIPLEPTQISAFAAHVQDTSIHSPAGTNHQHANVDILDELNDQDGNLTYKGHPIVADLTAHVNADNPHPQYVLMSEVTTPASPAERAAAGEFRMVIGYALNGLPDSETQAKIDVLLAAGWPDWAILWRDLGEVADIISGLLAFNPMVFTPTAAGISCGGISLGVLVLVSGTFQAVPGTLGLEGIYVTSSGIINLVVASLATTFGDLVVHGINANAGGISWTSSAFSPSLENLPILGIAIGSLSATPSSFTPSIGSFQVIGYQIGSLSATPSSFVHSIGSFQVIGCQIGALLLSSASLASVMGSLSVTKFGAASIVGATSNVVLSLGTLSVVASQPAGSISENFETGGTSWPYVGTAGTWNRTDPGIVINPGSAHEGTRSVLIPSPLGETLIGVIITLSPISAGTLSFWVSVYDADTTLKVRNGLDQDLYSAPYPFPVVGAWTNISLTYPAGSTTFKILFSSYADIGFELDQITWTPS